MAVTEEYLTLVYETKGAQYLDDLKNQMDSVATMQERLSAQYQAGTVSETDFISTTKLNSSALADLRNQQEQYIDIVNKANASTQALGNQFSAFTVATVEGGKTSKTVFDLGERMKAIATDDFTSKLSGASQMLVHVDETTTKATNKMAGFGQAGLQAGRAMQDFAQGGFAGVLNNIESVTMAMGGTAGLAGILTVVGLAAWAATPQIKAFFESLGAEKIDQTSTSIEGIKKKLKELNDTPIKFTIDYIAIAALEARLKQLEDRKKVLEKTSESGGEKMVREMGTAALTGMSYDSGDLETSTATVLKSDPNGLKNYLKGEDAARMSQLPKDIELLKKTLEIPGLDELGAFTMANSLRDAQKELKLLVTKNEQALLQHAKDMVADVGRSSFDSITAMQNLTAQFPGAFPPEFISKLNALPSNSEEFKAIVETTKTQKKDSAEQDREKTEQHKEEVAVEKQYTSMDSDEAKNLAAWKRAQGKRAAAAKTAQKEKLTFHDRTVSSKFQASQRRTKRQAHAIMSSPMGPMLAAMRANVRTQPTEAEQLAAAMHGQVAQPPSAEHQQMQFRQMVQGALVREGLAKRGMAGFNLSQEVAGLAGPQFEKSMSGELAGQMLRTNYAGVNAQNAIFNAQMDGFSQAERGFDHLRNRAAATRGYPGMNTLPSDGG